MDSGTKKEQLANLITSLQNNLWYSLGITILALVSGGTLAYELIADDITEDTLLLMHRMDLAVAWIFLADFSMGLYFAPRKLKYIRRNWLDLISSIPYPRSIFQALRLARLGRIARLFRAVNASVNFKGGAKKLYGNAHHKDNEKS